MKRGWFDHPIVSVMVAASWLVLQNSAALPHLITALVLAIGLPRLLHGFLGAPSHPRRLGVALRLLGVVVWDVIVSNLVVARIVLSPWVQPRPAWVPVPLDTCDRSAVTLLATIITTTPGTVSCVVDNPRHLILVHALDCADPQALAADIKQRYERPLMEIFG